MISGNIKYKKPKLTADTKALRAAVKEVGRAVTKDIKNEMTILTGSLRMSIAMKQFNRGLTSKAIIGARTRYERQGKVPNLYARKIEDKYHTMTKHINANTVNLLKNLTRDKLWEMVNNGN